METPLKINEADEISEADFKELKSWLSTQPHLPTIPDNMLHVFHHSCFHDLNKTKECIDVYYTIRSSTPEVFKNRDVMDKSLEVSVNNLTLNILPKRTPEGYQIIFERLESTDGSKYNFEESCRLFFMAIDSIIHNEGIVPGYVIVLDYKNVRLGHLMKTSISTMRKMFKYLQEGAPVRLQSIHMINMNYFVDKVMTFVKPFMQKELFDIIHFYQEGQLEKLFPIIPADCLPSDYGGEQPSSFTLKKIHISRLEKDRPYFKEEENAFPVMESLRPENKKTKKKKDDDGISEISLKSLDID